MNPDPDLARKTLLEAQQAMQRGDRKAARVYAEQAVALAPDSEDPWLTLAALSSPRASVEYLERALKINPHSPRARKGMHWAIERLRREQAAHGSKTLGIPTSGPAKEAETAIITQPVAARSALSEPKTQPRHPVTPVQPLAAKPPIFWKPSLQSNSLLLIKMLSGLKESKKTLAALSFPPPSLQLMPAKRIGGTKNLLIGFYWMHLVRQQA